MYSDYPFQAHYLHVDGGRLHYIDEGSGPVIVMVHGNPTWSYYFRHFIALLSKTHRVIAIDHMGCGLSDKPQVYDYCLRQHIENLETLLDSLEIKRFSMIVHDWGGAIGMGCAVKRITDLEKIVVLNTAAFRSTKIPLRIALCRLPFVGEVIVRLFNGFAWPATFMAVKKKMDRATCKSYLAPYNTWENRVAVYGFVRDIPLKASHKSYATLLEIEMRLERLREAEVPLMIIWGGEDFCFNDHFYEEWQRRFPKAKTFYFKDGGHYILEDKLADIKPVIKAFFRDK